MTEGEIINIIIADNERSAIFTPIITRNFGKIISILQCRIGVYLDSAQLEAFIHNCIPSLFNSRPIYSLYVGGYTYLLDRELLPRHPRCARDYGMFMQQCCILLTNASVSLHPDLFRTCSSNNTFQQCSATSFQSTL